MNRYVSFESMFPSMKTVYGVEITTPPPGIQTLYLNYFDKMKTFDQIKGSVDVKRTNYD